VHSTRWSQPGTAASQVSWSTARSIVGTLMDQK
jgi:hypothetical protein